MAGRRGRPFRRSFRRWRAFRRPPTTTLRTHASRPFLKTTLALRSKPHLTPVEHFLSSFPDYEDAIPGLPLGPGAAAVPASRGADAADANADADADNADAHNAPSDPRAALLRAIAADPSLCPPPLSGAAFMSRALSLRLLPIGADAVDALLSPAAAGGGGLREGLVHEVAGETASGKTQLCLQAAATRAAHGERVLYVDTTGGFSAARLARLAAAAHAAAVAEVRFYVAAL